MTDTMIFVAASLALTLGALLLAGAGLRRSAVAGERNRSLERQLAAEREARQLADQGLAASHEVLCRLVRQQDAARSAAGTTRGAACTGSLRHALERCLVEHAEQFGVRCRFEAGVDPAAHPVGRAVRLAVFEVLQEVLAGCKDGRADLHVRLSEGVNTLALDVQAGASVGTAPLPPTEALASQVRALGGVLRLAAAPGRPSHWSLSLRLRATAEPAGVA
jgi:hypothetical protein